LTVRSQFEKDSFLKDEKRTSEQSTELPLPKDYPESIFCPRYVSAWCMSKRKRCFDLVLGVAALILFSPIIVLVGWLIKITSKGPALFRQERVGLHQRTFVILKFRTMEHVCAQVDRGLTVTKQGDPRMTRVGAHLRRLKLDELPQLINVVRGHMSFVGPRPKIPQHENLQMLCRPGITGAATIMFSHEESLLAEIPEEFVERYVTSVLNPQKCRLDSRYIETARFGTDLRILARTIFKLSNRIFRLSNRIFKLSNRPKSTQAPQPALFLHKKSSMERPASIGVSRVESVEFSMQED
jgi:lipopolysaccharide/colanic/teichoic acid biosynthesis glycosyltransferase